MKATSPPLASSMSTPTWTYFSNRARQHAAVATEAAAAMFRGFEAMRKVQEDTAREAAQRHATAARQLSGLREPADFVSIQSELLRFNLEGATHYWKQLSATALEMHSKMLACCVQLVDAAAVLEGVSTLEAVAESLPGVAPGRTRTSRAKPASRR